MVAEEKKLLCENALNEYLSSSLSLRELTKHYKGITRDFLGGYFFGKGIDIYSRKSHVNDHIFDSIDTEEKAYWLGFLYADGNVHLHSKSWKVELGLQEQDYEHLVKYAAFIGYSKQPSYRPKTKSYRIVTGSRLMAEQLMSKGCVPRKSLILTFPSYDVVPKELMRHFIRGYFDGDGCITLRHNVNSTVPIPSLLGTKEFLQGLLNEIGFADTQIIKKEEWTASNTYNLVFRKEQGYRFLDYMYKDAAVFLQRKYNRYLLKENT